MWDWILRVAILIIDWRQVFFYFLHVYRVTSKSWGFLIVVSVKVDRRKPTYDTHCLCVRACVCVCVSVCVCVCVNESNASVNHLIDMRSKKKSLKKDYRVHLFFSQNVSKENWSKVHFLKDLRNQRFLQNFGHHSQHKKAYVVSGFYGSIWSKVDPGWSLLEEDTEKRQIWCNRDSLLLSWKCIAEAPQKWAYKISKVFHCLFYNLKTPLSFSATFETPFTMRLWSVWNKSSPFSLWKRGNFSEDTKKAKKGQPWLSLGQRDGTM